MRLADDAIRAALEIDGSQVEDGEEQMDEIWTVER